MNELAVITTATNFDKHIFELFESCRKFRIVPITVGFEGRLLNGHVENKILVQKVLPDIAKRYPITMYVDAFDCIIVDTAEAIVEEFKALDAPIVFGAERYCFPQGREDLFPPSPTPYRFLNAGGFIGFTDHLIQFFNVMNPESWDRGITDQKFTQDYYFHNVHMIKLDYHCRIFQTMVNADNDIEYGRWIRNTVTGSYPKVIHGNGGWDMTKPLAWLNNAKLP